MSEQVWHRFEGKRKDGSVLKLRIQDLPPDRVNDALELIVNYYIREESVQSYRFEKIRKDGRVFKLRIQDLPEDRRDEVADLMMKHYASEEPVHKGVGMTTDPETYKMYSQYMRETLNDSKYSSVTCCSDDSEDIKDIMGISLIAISTDYNSWDSIDDAKKPATREWDKFMAICYDIMLTFNPMEKYILSVFYDDRALLVVPDYRGLGIAQALFKSRRLVSAAHGVSMTGAWMTGYGSQIAAQRDGWEVACEINYQDLAKKHGVTFTDVPETMKFMIGRAN